jgi:hypothetical protein
VSPRKLKRWFHRQATGRVASCARLEQPVTAPEQTAPEGAAPKETSPQEAPHEDTSRVLENSAISIE